MNSERLIQIAATLDAATVVEIDRRALDALEASGALDTSARKCCPDMIGTFSGHRIHRADIGDQQLGPFAAYKVMLSSIPTTNEEGFRVTAEAVRAASDLDRFSRSLAALDSMEIRAILPQKDRDAALLDLGATALKKIEHLVDGLPSACLKSLILYVAAHLVPDGPSMARFTPPLPPLPESNGAESEPEILAAAPAGKAVH